MDLLFTVLAIAACVLLFSLAIFVHEFGHFVAARRRGLAVEAFSIGFGPVIWKKTVDGVEWRISAIPFGGYVAIPDVDSAGTAAAQGSAVSSAGKATPVDTIIVAVAGPLGNIVLAVVLAVLLALAPGARFGETPPVIGGFIREAADGEQEGIPGPAEAAGMKAGDRVVSVGGVAVDSWSAMQVEVQISGGKPVEFVVERDGAEIPLSISPVRNEASGAYYILAHSETNAAKAAAWMPSRNPLRQLEWDALAIVRVLKALVTPREAKAAARSVGGPVMIAYGLYAQVRSDVWDAVGFLRFLCINLAILNLLPIPVLDGSIVMFSLYTLLFRRKPNEKFTAALTRLFMWLLVAAMLFLVYRDSARLVRIHQAAENTRKEKAQ